MSIQHSGFPMTMTEYCERHSLELSIYEKDQEHFLNVSGGSKATSSLLHQLILSRYPHAQLLSKEVNGVVYNLGTVFDLIQNAKEDSRPSPFPLPLLRSVMPNIIANELVSVQPMTAAQIFTIPSAYNNHNKDTE